MNHKAFSELVANRIENCHDVLNQKDKEYSSGDDRFHNFKKAGQMKGQDPIQALDGMWLKHRVSLEDMLDKLAKDPDYVPSKEYIAEKFGDMINYTLLLEGLIEDRRNVMFEGSSYKNQTLEEKKIEVEAHINKYSRDCPACNVTNSLKNIRYCACNHTLK